MSDQTTPRQRLAVIGAGVAGVVSAYLLSRQHEVTLLEADSAIGGHTHTVTVQKGPDAGLAVDTGFIVLNDRTYPLFHTFLAQLQVPTRWSDMSFGLYDETNGFCYAGTSFSGLFAQRLNLVRPSYYAFLAEILRFFREGRALLASPQPVLAGEQTLGEFVARQGYSATMVRDYLIPMTAAIWSAANDDVLRFPLAALLSFFQNHGLLGLSDRPRWQTVTGGSAQYLRAFERRFSGTIRCSAAVAALSRDHNGVSITLKTGEQLSFDGAVVATHADQALRLLADPSPDEQRLLGSWRYQRNTGALHTDVSLLPPKRCAWASWNYRRFGNTNDRSAVSISYYMNRLQGLNTPREYIVSLNSLREPRSETVVAELDFLHPVYTPEALRTQSELPNLNGVHRTWFCGSYFRHGFHEDAVRSAVDVAADFKIPL